MTLPQRPLGKTGSEVPIIGYGTAPMGKIKLMDAPLLNKSIKLLHHAIDHGITYLDTSPDYGSQPKLGEVGYDALCRHYRPRPPGGARARP